VRIADEPCPGEKGAINDAGVVEAVGEDHISLPDDGGNYAGVGRVAGVEDKGRLGPFESRDARFQLLVQFRVAGNQAGGAAPRAEALHGPERRFLQHRVVRQTEIVVGTEEQLLAAVQHYPARLPPLQKPQ